MIKIAYIIDTIATPGAGTEQQLLMLLRGLDRNRFEPTLICLRNSEWLSKQSFPFEVIVLGLGRLLGPSFLSGLIRFRRLHRQRRFDIVQTFFLDANLFGTIAARVTGIRKVISSRRNIGYWHTGFYRMLLRCLRRWTPYYLANSKAVVEVSAEAEKVPAERVTVIYNGLDLTRFDKRDESIRREQRRAWGVAEDEILIGAVANLRPVKNITSFIDAAAVLTRDSARLKFVVVGEGPLRETLQQKIDTAGLADRFVLAGSHIDIVPPLVAFDMAVLCSRSESFSNSLVEYMAAGLPVVASAVGGNGEAIRHGENGRLYAVDDPDGLVRELKALLDDPERARQFGAAAKERAFLLYSKEACLRQHEEYYLNRVMGGVTE